MTIIREIQGVNAKETNGSIVDSNVIGAIKSISPATTVHARITFKPLTIVRLLLFDSTGKIEINIWNAM
ncbi:unnamed protein product, partial [Rotaria magnacalcarata]